MHAVGVARQYSGLPGKQDNCQAVVSLSVANERLSLPVAYELCVPETWTESKDLRRTAGIPDDIVFRTKLEFATGQIRTAVEEGAPGGVVLGEAGHGKSTAFRDGIKTLDPTYMVGIQAAMTVWP